MQLVTLHVKQEMTKKKRTHMKLPIVIIIKREQ